MGWKEESPSFPFWSANFLLPCPSQGVTAKWHIEFFSQGGTLELWKKGRRKKKKWWCWAFLFFLFFYMRPEWQVRGRRCLSLALSSPSCGLSNICKSCTLGLLPPTKQKLKREMSCRIGAQFQLTTSNEHTRRHHHRLSSFLFRTTKEALDLKNAKNKRARNEIDFEFGFKFNYWGHWGFSSAIKAFPIIEFCACTVYSAEHQSSQFTILCINKDLLLVG